jgi:hypothetical protein
MRRGFVIVCILFLALAVSAPANLLTNGDFELGSNGTTGPDTVALGWNQYNSSGGWNNRETTGNPVQNNYLIAIGAAGGYGAYAYQDVPGSGRTIYIFTADAALDTWWRNSLYLKIEFYNAGGTAPENMIGFAESDHYGQPGYDTGLPWANYRIEGVAPVGTALVRVMLGTYGEGGTARFDNAVLVKGVPKATNPAPRSGEIVGSSLSTLSWTNPDPNNPADTITSNVYLYDAGTAPLADDPNLGPVLFEPGVLLVAENTAAESVEIPIALEEDHYYYWAVHCTDPHGDPNNFPFTTQGDTWVFFTGDALPVVHAGPDQFNWIAKEDGDGNPNEYTITVVGTYTDDGKSPIADANFINLNWGWDPANGEYGIEKISQTWIPGPGIHTSGTVTAVYKTLYTEGGDSTAIPGYWDLQLQVTDGTGTGQDVVYVRVDVDCATAARNDAGDPYDGYYDVNKDCIIDLADFAAFAEAWLDCNANKLTTCP